MSRKSSRGTARWSKKLLELYSFNRFGGAPWSGCKTFLNCVGSAPGGVGPSIVQRHKSQNEQVNGHSAPTRKTVRTSSILPPGRRSTSINDPCAKEGSASNFDGRRLRIRWSTAEA